MSSAKTGALPVFEGNKDDEFIIHLTFLQLVKRVLVLIFRYLTQFTHPLLLKRVCSIEILPRCSSI